ncbi:MAG: Mrp/NBP35 family ATP-binding protein [Dehalococcoidales bacterium]|nr:Mrp/NBP35 family ATP-binding protein [Dehalococcoidales bacterium]
MVTEQALNDAVKTVIVPGVERSLDDLNLIQKITIREDGVEIALANAALGVEVQEYLTDSLRAALAALKIKTVTVTYHEVKPIDLNHITHVVAVMSGKGGVGKSSVSAMLAVALNRAGKSTGILDADITGSSMPKMFGLKNRPLGSENGILPVASASGISIISMNLMLPEQESAVIWRAPLLTKAIQQFWGEVLWGKLDYLIIDLPPGTADAPLTVMQSIPIQGVIIVSTPQSLVEMIVKKAVNMAQKMQKPILGIVENMSYFYVPELKKKYELFGKSKGAALAKDTGVPLLAILPIEPDLARLADEGKIELYEAPSVKLLGEAVIQAVEKKPETLK